ncbi:dihydroorotate dehydrogenase [Methanosarcina mazei]|uniref:Dihydroorotate dehydrogenase n=1 Tax=Methanosarcina mazei TaxID=2209 RepID=A0A0F8R9A0_METMZ|nr:dihydroorotate dehydrogenase [Methanosarcina mazei]KKG08035.1 dihydroorotate dehydrogenase [Methanosarcina mazei]KKG14574.1 dihydroorotate dehydrogenase [Methanosarcina mazei]KKG31124.1 dihydroorotate dehydrogenase [Methanosarcina mazei]KKG38273.1 dihydroorotate dehydrogenase [Methanosarcina mazei]
MGGYFLDIPKFKRLPRHIAIIPDGNRRWALARGLEKHEGYSSGIIPGLEVYDICVKIGIGEVTFFGFTQDNTKRPQIQRKAFTDACIKSVQEIAKRDAEILVVGNTNSDIFPEELLEYTKRTKVGKGKIKINFLINYGWYWDLTYAYDNSPDGKKMIENIASAEIPRVDLLIRWGGRCRLSGMLPVQTVYSDIYVVDEMWPDFKPEHLFKALEFYQKQDITLGG